MAKIMNQLKLLLLGAAGATLLLTAGQSGVSQDQAYTKAETALTLLGCSGSATRISAKRFQLRSQPNLPSHWIIKLRRGTTTFTTMVRERDGSMATITSSRDADRHFGKGRTGNSAFANSNEALNFCKEGVRKLVPDPGFEVTEFRLTTDGPPQRMKRVCGSARLVFRYHTQGYRHINPMVRGMIEFDSQDRALIRYEGPGKKPAVAGIPGTLIARDEACRAAFGKVFTPTDLKSEIIGWVVPKGQQIARLAYLFTTERRVKGQLYSVSVTVDAATGAVLKRES
jgi:hypothetical protein